MNRAAFPRPVAVRRRVHPVVWTFAGAVAGALAGLDWGDPLALRVSWDFVSLGILAGLFATVVSAAWPGGRDIPTEACPRCGHRMPWAVVVCPECGEIR